MMTMVSAPERRALKRRIDAGHKGRAESTYVAALGAQRSSSGLSQLPRVRRRFVPFAPQRAAVSFIAVNSVLAPWIAVRMTRGSGSG